MGQLAKLCLFEQHMFPHPGVILHELQLLGKFPWILLGNTAKEQMKGNTIVDINVYIYVRSYSDPVDALEISSPCRAR